MERVSAMLYTNSPPGNTSQHHQIEDHHLDQMFQNMDASNGASIQPLPAPQFVPPTNSGTVAPPTTPLYLPSNGIVVISEENAKKIHPHLRRSTGAIHQSSSLLSAPQNQVGSSPSSVRFQPYHVPLSSSASGSPTPPIRRSASTSFSVEAEVQNRKQQERINIINATRTRRHHTRSEYLPNNNTHSGILGGGTALDLIAYEEYQRKFQQISGIRPDQIVSSSSSHQNVGSNNDLGGGGETTSMQFSRLSPIVEKKHMLQVYWFWGGGASARNEAIANGTVETLRRNSVLISTTRDEIVTERVSLQTLGANNNNNNSEEIGLSASRDDITANSSNSGSANNSDGEGSLIRRLGRSNITGGNSGEPSHTRTSSTTGRSQRNDEEMNTDTRIEEITETTSSGTTTAATSSDTIGSRVVDALLRVDSANNSSSRLPSVSDNSNSNSSTSSLPRYNETVDVVTMLPMNDRYGILYDPSAEEEEVVELPFIRGLGNVRAYLEHMLLQPTERKTRGLFYGALPPPRHVFVHSDSGSGICTLLKSICKSNKINIIRITINADVTWSDDMFLNVISYARLIQPCVVLFDRCDAWWLKDGFPMRGEKFLLWHGNFPYLVQEQVWFLFSSSHPIENLHPNFRAFIGYRHLTEFGLSEEDRWKCFKDFFLKMLNGMRDNCVNVPENVGALIDDVMNQLSEVCFELARKYPVYTPSMIKEYTQKVMEAARIRAIKGALHEENIDFISSIPIENDFTWVDSSIDSSFPGHIIWKY